MATLADRLRARNPLPEGSLAVGLGLVASGAMGYGFLVISARVLGPQRYASLSALWVLTFLVVPAFYFPVEQEVGRASAARHALGRGTLPLLRRAAVATLAVAVALVVIGGALSGPMDRRLFDGHALLQVAFLLAVVGYGAEHLVKGALSGHGRFGAYGLVLGAEGFVRLAVCVAAWIAGAATAGPFGIAIGIAPFLAALVGLAGDRDELLQPGPEAAWSDLWSGLGFLFVGSALSQVLLNAGPLLVKVLANGHHERVLAGRFLATLVIARVPLLLFQAVQTALLPKLSRLAAAGRFDDFRSGLRRLLLVVAGVAMTGLLGAVVAGPPIIRLLFGNRFLLTRADLAYLAAGSGAFMAAQTLAQALIALEGHARAAAGWLAGVVVFVAVAVAQSGLLLRAEQAFVLGAVAATVAMAALLRRALDHTALAAA